MEDRVRTFSLPIAKLSFQLTTSKCETQYEIGHRNPQTLNVQSTLSVIMIALRSIVTSAVILTVCRHTRAWMLPTVTGTRSTGTPIPISFVSLESRSFTTLNAEKSEATRENDEVDSIDNDDSKPIVEWGVSYIGGDPCGSKYNSDPFDKQPSDKPGMPNDMKARIAALAQKKLEEENEK